MKLPATVLGFVFVSSLLLPAPLAAASKFRIGYSAITATMAPLWAGQEKGLFVKYGIDPELIYLAGGGRIALALESESIQIGQMNVNAGVEARLAGGTITIIGSIYDTYYFQIFGKPGMYSAAQLKAKSLPPVAQVPPRNMAYETPWNLLGSKRANTRSFMRAAPMAAFRHCNEA